MAEWNLALHHDDCGNYGIAAQKAMSTASEIRWQHSRSPAFNKAFASLPTQIQEQARAKFRVLARNPEMTDLHPMIYDRSTYRIGFGNYRAIARRKGNHFRWTFIGSHEAYNKVVWQR